MDTILQKIKDQLISMVENRPYVFVNTFREDAEAYLTNQISFQGYSEQDLLQMENQLAIKFPAIFRLWLKHFGKHSGSLVLGSASKMSEFAEYKEQLKNALDTNTTPFIRKNTIAFVMHQGYHFYLLHDDEGNDPPVYAYGELDENVEKIADSFSEFLEMKMKELEYIHQFHHKNGGYILEISNGFIKQSTGRNGIKPLEMGDFFL